MRIYNNKTKEKRILQLVSAAVLMASMFLAAAAIVGPAAEAGEADNCFYVGTGTQWSDMVKVYSNPQAAVNDAASWSTAHGNTQAYVLVAIGTYDASALGIFSLKDGVTITGGFAGTESGLAPTYNQNIATPSTNTVFSGNDTTGVFSNTGVGATACLQNAVITKGYAYHGGGMRNNSSSPTVTNCTFTGNEADVFGGGMYNGDNSSPTVTNCTFTGNEAVALAGGMYNGDSSSTVTNCIFTDNKAGNGGGMGNIRSSLTIVNCTYNGNIATDSTASGGGMYNSGSSLTIVNCTFTGNEAGYGGGMYNSDNSSPTVTNCTFTGNEATVSGGGMLNYSTNSTIVNCTFTGNEAGYGGGMYNVNCSPTVTNSTFTGNKADHGGGMYNSDYGSPTITNCTFTGNEATTFGGGMYNVNCSPTVTNSKFTGNKADYGGGMYNSDYSSPTITNCTFTGNEATTFGGGLYKSNGTSGPTLTNCTIINNTALTGGGMYNGGDETKLVNCMVALNTATTAPEIYVSGQHDLTILSSVIGGSAYDSTGFTSAVSQAPAPEDFGTDGILTSTAAYAIKKGDYDLYTTSLTPVIAVLDNAYGTNLTAASMRDINGNKVVGPSNQIDIGAFRYIGTGESGDEFNPSTISLPEPFVTAYSKGLPYVSGTLTNAPVDIYAHMGDISTMTGYPFLPQSYLEDILFAVSTDGFSYVPHTGPINVASDGAYSYYFRNYAAVAGPIVEMDVLIDMTMPTVSSVVPYGTSVALTANTIGIIFSEDMDMGVNGTVTCDNGLTLAFSGWIYGDTVTYDITSGNLTPNTTYTVSISGFADLAGNYMTADSSHDFTTVKASPNIAFSADPLAGQTYPGNVVLTATLSGAYPNNSGRMITFSAGGSTFTETTNASGEATHTMMSPVPGTYALGVSFASDTYNDAATANVISGYNVDKGTLTAGDFGFSPLTVPYDSTSKAVTPSYTVSGIGAITVYYDALTAAPTDAGTYEITIDVDEGTYYYAATGLSLGNFTISRAEITVEPDGSQSKIAGKGDPALTYGVTSGTLYGSDTFSGSLERDPGEGIGLYEITQGSLTAGSNYDLTFTPGVFFEILPAPHGNYYITSSANGGASVSPQGTVTLSRGANITFFFSASSVKVDGSPLSPAEVALGHYTFRNVIMNHSIDATGAAPRSVIYLYVNAGEGGHAEYSVNGSPFTEYTSSVPITEGSSLVLKAVADNGYKFKEWKDGNAAYADAELTFSGVTASVDMTLTFAEDGGGFPLWIVGAVIVLLAIVALAAVVFMRKGKN